MTERSTCNGKLMNDGTLNFEWDGELFYQPTITQSRSVLNETYIYEPGSQLYIDTDKVIDKYMTAICECVYICL